MTPASIRNNNPGALKCGPSARKFGGQNGETLVSKDGRHGIARFPTAIHGAAALFDNLLNARRALDYYYRGKTLAKAIETWCGAIRAQSYLRLIEQQTGLKGDVVLSEAFLRDHEQAIALARAMARHEAGVDFPLDGNGWLQAHAMAFSGGHIAPEPLPNNDVPTLRLEAREAQAVAIVSKPAAASSGVVAGGLTWLSGNVPSVDVLASWQASAAKLGEIVSWGVGNWRTVLMTGVAYGFACHVLPWLAKGRV